jgi:ParB family transcriptional regulator, chromosome partitioning protein
MGAATEYEKGHLYHLSVLNLHANPDQPRKYFDPVALEELTRSVMRHGVIEPILFSVDGKKCLRVVAGERRAEAARRAGLATIPAIYVEGNHNEIALVENLFRQDLTAIEEAEALKALMDEQDYTQEQLSAMIGKARSTVAEILSLNRLPQQIRNECRKNPSISRSTLLQIARRKQARAMLTMYGKYRKDMAKELDRRKKPVRRSAGQRVVGVLTQATNLIEKTGMAGWSESDKSRLESIMNKLHETVTLYLAQ